MNNEVVELKNNVVGIETDIDSVRKMQGPRGFNGSRVSVQQLVNDFFYVLWKAWEVLDAPPLAYIWGGIQSFKKQWKLHLCVDIIKY